MTCLMMAWIWKLQYDQFKEYLEKLEGKLKEEQSWKHLLMELQSGILIIDTEHQINFANAATFSILKKQDSPLAQIKDYIYKSSFKVFHADVAKGASISVRRYLDKRLNSHTPNASDQTFGKVLEHFAKETQFKQDSGF